MAVLASFCGLEEDYFENLGALDSVGKLTLRQLFASFSFSFHFEDLGVQDF